RFLFYVGTTNALVCVLEIECLCTVYFDQIFGTGDGRKRCSLKGVGVQSNLETIRDRLAERQLDVSTNFVARDPTTTIDRLAESNSMADEFDRWRCVSAAIPRSNLPLR